MRKAKRNSGFYEIFSAYDFDGITKLSGLTVGNGGLSLKVYKNDTEITDQSITISEFSTSGNYSLTTTFTSKGYWVIFVNIIDSDSSQVIQTQRIDIQVDTYTVDDVYNATGSGEESGVGSETVTLTVSDSEGSVIPQVAINIFNANKTAFITFGSTNTSGQRIFNLDPGIYKLTLFLFGYSFTETDLTVTDTSGLTPQTLGITAETLNVVAPSAPGVCRIFGDFVLQNGSSVGGTKVSVTNLYDPSDPTGFSVVEETKIYTANATGRIQFDIVQGVRVQITIISTNVAVNVTIPNQAVANLFDIIEVESESLFSTIQESDPDNILIVGV